MAWTWQGRQGSTAFSNGVVGIIPCSGLHIFRPHFITSVLAWHLGFLRGRRFTLQDTSFCLHVLPGKLRDRLRDRLRLCLICDHFNARGRPKLHHSLVFYSSSCDQNILRRILIESSSRITNQNHPPGSLPFMPFSYPLTISN